MRSFFALVALVSSACAYSVVTPNSLSGWTTGGPNIVTWQRVVTDPQNFTMLLVNQNPGILSGGQEILVALVNGSALTYTVPPPSGGFPAGTGFQVNFVQDPTNLNTIYAQSGQFAITASSSTISPLRTVASTSATPTNPTTPATVAATTDTPGGLNPTGTSTSSGNGADRIAAAGSTALLFAALTVFIL